MGIVANLWRHPIKGVGREELASVDLKENCCMPMDRYWAITHENSKVNFKDSEWATCINFIRAASSHKLMAVSSTLDDDTGLITLSHPELVDLTINPNTDSQALIDWVKQITNTNRSMPTNVFKANRGLTDSSSQTVSIHVTATLLDLSKTMRQPLDQRRFRGNIWLDDMIAWSEFDWIGKTISIGTTEIQITGPIERCMATTVNPDTGTSDANTLAALNTTYGHQNFGVFGIVKKSGHVNIGDKADLI